MKNSVCPVKITIAVAVIALSALAITVPKDVPINAIPFFAMNFASVLLNPTWKRRCRQRCWLKSGAILALIIFGIALPVLVPESSGHSITLLCLASGLGLCLPTTSALANRSSDPRQS